jgi:DNA-binding transcriptional LysR family regulator
LRYFEAAARRLSFAEAARELFITPAAVSHQIKRLEAHLAVPLFERHNRMVVLTGAGAKLAATLHTLFAELNEALAQIKEPKEPKIRVSALPSLAAKWLVPRLHRFDVAYPALKVRIDTSDHLVNFAYEPFDVALRYGASNYPGLHVDHLMAADAFPVCSPRLLGNDHPPLKKATDLRRHTLLHDESSELSKGVQTGRCGSRPQASPRSIHDAGRCSEAFIWQLRRRSRGMALRWVSRLSWNTIFAAADWCAHLILNYRTLSASGSSGRGNKRTIPTSVISEIGSSTKPIESTSDAFGGVIGSRAKRSEIVYLSRNLFIAQPG